MPADPAPGSPTDPAHRVWLDDQFFRLVSFATRSRLAAGGFGYLDENGEVDPDRPRELLISCRMTHVFALAQLRGLRGTADLVDHGVLALTELFADRDNGGWCSAVAADGRPEPGRKLAYEHAFVVLAATSATAAGHPAGSALLDQALDVVQQRFWDPAAGLVQESYAADFTDPESYRGANSNMHTVEAFLAAGDVTGDPLWHQRALSIADRLINGAARAHRWSLPEHFDTDWKPLLDYNSDQPADQFRPYGSTVGHWLEWSRLLLHLDASVPDAPAWLGESAAALFDHAVSAGWDVDGHDGFVYTLDFDDRVVVGTRLHWVLTEGIADAAVLLAATGEPRYLEWYQRFWQHARQYFVEEDRGSWRHELTPELVEAGAVWPGRPDAYHAATALLVPQLPLAPCASVALERAGTPR